MIVARVKILGVRQLSGRKLSLDIYVAPSSSIFLAEHYFAHNHHLGNGHSQDNRAKSKFDGNSVGLAADHHHFPYPNASLSVIMPR
jgi:hypothetical protein